MSRCYEDFYQDEIDMLKNEREFIVAQIYKALNATSIADAKDALKQIHSDKLRQDFKSDKEILDWLEQNALYIQMRDGAQIASDRGSIRERMGRDE